MKMDLGDVLNNEAELTLEYEEPMHKKKSTIGRIKTFRSITLRKTTLKEEELMKATRR